MMLRDPYIDEAFEPDLMWFVGVFNVYDREETKGAELEIYNPNDKADRAELIKKYSLNLEVLTYRHKLALLEYLAGKLEDKNYSFQSVFEIEEDEASSWPRSEWYELDNPRGFFEDIYRIAKDEWEKDLQKASVEDQSTW